MNQALEFIADKWFSLALLVLAVVCAGLLLYWRLRRQSWSLSLLLVGAALACVAIGGLVIQFEVALWMGGGLLLVLFGMLLVVIITGSWWAPLGYFVGTLLLAAIGGAGSEAAGQGLVEAGKVLTSLEATQPWWLLLLGFIPVIIWLSYRSLAGLGPLRRWLAIGLRCLLVVFLTLALAEVRCGIRTSTSPSCSWSTARSASRWNSIPPPAPTAIALTGGPSVSSSLSMTPCNCAARLTSMIVSG